MSSLFLRVCPGSFWYDIILPCDGLLPFIGITLSRLYWTDFDWNWICSGYSLYATYDSRYIRLDCQSLEHSSISSLFSCCNDTSLYFFRKDGTYEEQKPLIIRY